MQKQACIYKFLLSSFFLVYSLFARGSTDTRLHSDSYLVGIEEICKNLQHLSLEAEGSLGLHLGKNSGDCQSLLGCKCEKSMSLIGLCPAKIKKIENADIFRLVGAPESRSKMNYKGLMLRLTVIEFFAATTRSLNFYDPVTGNTPLLLAIANANWHLAFGLIQLASKGVDVGINTLDRQNLSSPLILAAAKGEPLSQQGEDDFVETPYLLVIKALLAGKADPNLRNRYGQSALHFATARRDERLLILLLQTGAIASLKDNRGCRPRDLLYYPYEEARGFLAKQTMPFQLAGKKAWQEKKARVIFCYKVRQQRSRSLWSEPLPRGFSPLANRPLWQ